MIKNKQKNQYFSTMSQPTCCSVCLEGEGTLINKKCGCSSGYFHENCFQNYQKYHSGLYCQVCKRKYKDDFMYLLYKIVIYLSENNYERYITGVKYYINLIYIYYFCRTVYEQKPIDKKSWIPNDILSMSFLFFLHVYPHLTYFSWKRNPYLISSYMMTIYSNIMVLVSNDKIPFIYMFLAMMHLPFLCSLCTKVNQY